jgi:uncharacterized protein
MTLLRSLLLSLALVFSTGTVAVSQDFDKGWDAYENGDYATALKEWRPFAEQGDAFAQFNLGWMYKNGEGVPQDYQEAAKWYRLAAEQGYAKAQYNLALRYDNGEGVPQDYQEAAKWYRLAAEQGHACPSSGFLAPRAA